jgi:anaerobic selenocysteine-containing dehydrogenase
VFPKTGDRKVNLFPPELDKQAPIGLYGYQPDPATTEFPLAMSSPSSERTISSTLGELPRPEVRLEMNPEDAVERGIKDGDAIRAWNALGEMRVNASVSPLIKRGIVAVPKGLWRRSTKNGYTSNAMVPDSLADLGGGACFNDARVQVERTKE